MTMLLHCYTTDSGVVDILEIPENHCVEAPTGIASVRNESPVKIPNFFRAGCLGKPINVIVEGADIGKFLSRYAVSNRAPYTY
jgi:hypothetical protein